MSRLNEQLKLIQLTEDVKQSVKAAKQIKTDEIKKAVESKNPLKIKKLLRQVPDMSIDDIHDLSSEKVSGFDGYYNHAMSSWGGKDVEVKKALASLYALFKSLEEKVPPQLRKRVKVFSKRLWIYSEGVTVRGITLSFVLWLISFFFIQGSITGTLIAAGITVGGYMFIVGLALTIIKWVLQQFPRRS
jgi:hypothetical protein